MRTYKSLTKQPRKCFHGIPMKDQCIDCIKFLIREKQTQIKLLRQTLRWAIKERKK